MDAEHPSSLPRLCAGFSSLLGAFVLLYVLACGPVAFYEGYTLPSSDYIPHSRPAIAEAYVPMWQAVRKTPLNRPLRAYQQWWYDSVWKFRPRPSPIYFY